MRFTIWDEPRTRPGTGSLRYYDPATGKRAKRVKYESKEDRREKKLQIQTMLQNWRPGSGAPYATPLVVFEQYLNALIHDTNRPRRKGTIFIKRQSLTKFLSSLVRMGNLTTERIVQWRNELIGHYGVDSVSIKLRDLRAFCVWCTKRGILASNPFSGVNIPISTFVGRRLNLNELQAIYTHLSDQGKAFMDIDIETGARKGEILAMEWADLDLDRRYWIIPGREGKSKGRKDRIIPLKDRSYNAIKQQPQSGPLVFQGYDRECFKRDWYRALRLVKIKGRVRPHDLRHTWASNFQGRASSLKAIAGWTTDQMMHHYRHVEVEELREDLEKSKFGADLGQMIGKNESNA